MKTVKKGFQLRQKKPEAQKFLTKFNKELCNNSKLEYISLADFKAEYLNNLEQAHTSAYLADVKTSFRVLIKNVGNIPLAKLNNRTLEKMLLELFSKSKYGAAHHYKNLRAILNKAIDWNYITENPMNSLTLLKIPKSLPAFINSVELKAIVQNTSSRDLQDIYLTGFHTSMRLSEIINLKWSAINLKEFHSPILRRTVKPDETDYLKHYEAALIFELNYLNKEKCSCSGCHDERKRIKKDLREILKIDINSLIR